MRIDLLLRLNVRIDLLLTCGQHLHDSTILIRGEVLREHSASTYLTIQCKSQKYGINTNYKLGIYVHWHLIHINSVLNLTGGYEKSTLRNPQILCILVTLWLWFVSNTPPHWDTIASTWGHLLTNGGFTVGKTTNSVYDVV